MIATLIIILFLLIIKYLKNSSIKILRKERKHGIFIFLLSKMLFWFSIIQLFNIWFPHLLIYVLPTILFLFWMNMLVERKFFVQVIKAKKTSTKT